MLDDRDIESLRAMARQAGLRLSEDELQRLLPGANRSCRQAADLRTILTADAEPAALFFAAAFRASE
jgi:hypothetical protein